MNEGNKNIELNVDQLGGVAGGEAKKGYETVICPHCSTGNEVRYQSGKTVTCSSCGEQFKI